MKIKLLAAVVLCTGSAVHSANFQGLGFLPGYTPGLEDSWATDISADGSMVVGFGDAPGATTQAFRWSKDQGMVGLGFLGDTFRDSQASAVSADGSVIVGSSHQSEHSTYLQAFRWTERGGMTGLGCLPGTNESWANDVSADGSVIVGASGQIGYSEVAVRWTENTGPVALYSLDEWSSGEAYAVSADGSVIVGTAYSATSGTRAFRWTESEGIRPLGDLEGGAALSDAYAVSSDGSAVVGQAGSYLGAEAFLWTASDGMVGLGVLDESRGYSRAYDVSADGSVVVGMSYVGAGVPQAFIWNKQIGMRNLQEVLGTVYGLDTTSWTLMEAYGISDDGKSIVGLGVNPDGINEAWLAVIPEPASILLLTFGAIFLRRKNLCSALCVPGK